MAFRTNEEVRITGVLGTASNSTVTCSKVINWRDGSGLEYDASWTTATVKIYTSRSNYEYGVCSASGGTLTFTMKGLDASGSKTEIASNKKQWRPGTKVTFVASASDLVDVDGDNTFSGTNTFTDINFTGTTTGGLKLKSLTTAQMNAIAAPAAGMIIYNSTAGENYQYLGGAWSAISAGSTQANASTTVAGKSETGTSAEATSGASTGGTGALLFLTPAEIAKAIQSGSWVYCASSTGSDTYTGTMTPTLTAYTAGMVVVAKFTTANTGACTINIDSLGAKSIKTQNGLDLADNTITASSMHILVYDGTNFVLFSPKVSKTDTLTLVAGESITAGNALRTGFVASGETITQGSGTTEATAFAIGYDNTYQAQGQSFTLANGGVLASVAVDLKKNGTPTGTLTAYIYATGDLTTPIATSTNTFSESALTGSFVTKTFTFAKPLVAGTYAYKIATDRANSATNYVALAHYSASSLYSGGIPYAIDSGGAWNTNGTKDHKFEVVVTATTESASKAYKHGAYYVSNTGVSFLGFAGNTAVLDGVLLCDISYNDKQSGLTQNSTYYLSNTVGAISTTAGYVSLVVARAISTTEVLIRLFT